MSHAASIDGVSHLPRSMVGRWLVGIRARRRRSQLDVALAQGADPWSTPELMARASRLGLRSDERSRQDCTDWWRSPRFADGHRRSSGCVVLEQRDSLLALAERIFQPEPVEVAVIAQLALLLSDPSSPVYAGGRDPGILADVTNRCLDRVSTDAGTWLPRGPAACCRSRSGLQRTVVWLVRREGLRGELRCLRAGDA